MAQQLDDLSRSPTPLDQDSTRREKMWCVPKIDGEYVARMEDVLDL